MVVHSSQSASVAGVFDYDQNMDTQSYNTSREAVSSSEQAQLAEAFWHGQNTFDTTRAAMSTSEQSQRVEAVWQAKH